MRAIGKLAGESQAHGFSDFLVAQGIRNQIERDGGQSWELWVLDDDHLEDAQQWLEKFQLNPNAPEFQGASARAASARAAEAQERADYQRRVRSGRSLFPKHGSYGFGLLTYGLILFCLIVAVYSHLGQNFDYLRKLFVADPALPPNGFLPQIFAGEVWRLFTPMFIHFGLLHLLFNMSWLYQLGCMIEGRRGPGTLAALVLVIEAITVLAQYEVSGPIFGGMSGVVYGLAGYVWIMGRYYRASGLYLDQRNLIIMLVWLALCYTGWLGNVANTSHLVGFIVGVAWGRLAAYWGMRRPH